MKQASMFSIILFALTTVACDRSEFAGAVSPTQAYSVSIKAPSEDSTGATGTDKTVATPDKTAATPDKTAATPDPKSGDTPDPSNNGDIKADCVKLSGTNSEKVKVSGSEKNIVITNQDALAFRVTGNKNLVTVDLKSQPVESQVKAICLFIAGNQNRVKLEISNHVGAIYIVSRGNQAQVEIATLKGSLIDTIDMDAKGNSGGLSLTGEGKFPCDKNNPSIHCQQ